MKIMKFVKINRTIFIGCFLILLSFAINILVSPYYLNELSNFDAFILLVVDLGPFTLLFIIIANIFPVLIGEKFFDVQLYKKRIGLNIVLFHIKESIKSGIIMISAYLIMIICCYIFFPNTIGIDFGNIGILGELRQSSPALYIGAYLIFIFAFGCVMNLFASGILLISKSKICIFLFTLIFYNIYLFIPPISGSLSIISDVLSNLPFDMLNILDYDIPVSKRIIDILVVCIISLFMIYFATMKKNEEEDDKT